MQCPLALYIDMAFGALPFMVAINSVHSPPDSAKKKKKSAKYWPNGPSISFDRSRLCRVGEAVGAAVGSIVGETVGVILGAAVGVAVGSADGFAVGDAVGAADGEAVGEAMGFAVGAFEGKVVGAAVGAAVGGVLGPEVGTADGGVVGHSITDNIHSMFINGTSLYIVTKYSPGAIPEIWIFPSTIPSTSFGPPSRTNTVLAAS